MNNLAHNALNEYQSTGNSSIAYADPHELILRLMKGALERLAQAKGAIERKNKADQGQLISNAINIIGGLEGCLNYEEGGEISTNLGQLYEYMNLTLAQANVEDDIGKVDQVMKLMLEIKSAWEQIPSLQEVQG